VGRWKDSETLYSYAMEARENNYYALYDMGRIHHERKELKEAIRLYEEVLRIIPDADTHNNLGSIYLEMGKPGEAMKAYRQSVGLDPYHSEANFNLGILLYAQGRVGEATKHFARAVLQRPDLRRKIEAIEKQHRQKEGFRPGENPSHWP